MDKRLIINEVQRQFPKFTDYTLQELLKVSPTLRGLIQSEGGEELITSNGTFFVPEFLTPTIINQIVKEIGEARDISDILIDSVQAASALPDLLKTSQTQTSPYLITDADIATASQYDDYEDIPYNENTLLTTFEGNVFLDPVTGALALAPTPNKRIIAPVKSEQDHVGPLTPEDMSVFAILVEDEIRLEREAQGIVHGIDTVDENEKMGVYGLTVENLVDAGVVSQDAVDSYNRIPEDQHEDYAYKAVLAGIISLAFYDNIPGILRRSLSWYVLSNANFWIQKLIGPKAFLTTLSIQRLLLQKEALLSWKKIFPFMLKNFIVAKSVIFGYLLASKIVGERAARAFNLGVKFATITGRTAEQIFNRGYKAIESGSKADNAKDIDKAAESVPPPPPQQPGTKRKYKFFPNIKEQPSNEALRKVPENQGFHDPNRIYPRVTHIGEPDTNRLARHKKIQDTIVQIKDDERIKKIPVARRGTPKTWDQPKSPYNAKYPYNHVQETESGHVIEYDDTPNNERMHWYHREGTFTEIDRNGTLVRKIVGDGYEIWERDGYVYIGGKCNITVEGDCNLYVKNNVNLQVDGNLTADVHKSVQFNVAKNFNVTAGGSINLKAKRKVNLQSTSSDINLKASNNANMSGKKVNVYASSVLKLSGEKKASLAAPTGQALLLSGAASVVINGAGLAMMPQPATAGIFARKNKASEASKADVGSPPAERNPVHPQFPTLTLEERVTEWSETVAGLAEHPEENADALKAVIKQGIDEGLVTKEEIERPVTEGEKDETPPPPAQPAKVASCQLIYSQKSFPASYSLSPRVTIGSLAQTHSRLRPQVGLTVQDIVCNLRQLSVNVIEPLYDLVGQNNVIITSVLRNPDTPTGQVASTKGVSFHQQGLAIDVQFRHKNKSEYYEIAKQIKSTMQYDQLLLEYRQSANGLTSWIHLSWNQPGINLAYGRAGGSARLQALTLKNDRTYARTLVNLLPNAV